MRIRNLIASLLLPTLALAQAPLEKKPQRTEAFLGSAPSCFMCQFTMSAQSEKAGQSKVCDDLFEASCIGADGKSKYAGRSKSLPMELNTVIKEARDKTAVLMGFKDFDDALKSKLKEAGLEVKEPVDPEAWRSLKKDGDGFSYGGDVAKRLYSAVDQCDQEADELLATLNKGVTDINQLTEIVKKYDVVSEKYREQKIRLHAEDIPNFMSNHINSKCNDIEFRPKVCRAEDNPDLVKACKNIFQIKRQAVNLFRLEGTPQYREQAAKFVRENLLPDANCGGPSQGAPMDATREPPRPQRSEVERLQDKILNSSEMIRQICYSNSRLLENAGNKVFESFVDDVNKMKPTVDAIIDSFYSESKKKMATKMFQEARWDIQTIASQLVKDRAKKTAIIEGYDRLQLFWMEKPGASAYKKNAKGIMVLDEDKATPEFVRMLNDDVYGTFSDPSLSFFTSLNADYRPIVNVGKYNKAERVSMMPAFLKVSEDNEYTFFAVIAHEVGHKIGPQVAKLYGYDLTSEYKDLLACYKDRKSIKLQDGQEDEVIADYISSEVLARQILRLPIEKRQQALMSAVEDFCIFDDSDSGINCKGKHPEHSLRVGGIYGANPNLRKVVGCDGDSPKFKSCGLSRISLPSDKGDSRRMRELSPSKAIQ